MTRDTNHVYAFDEHLDDTHPWEAGIYTCPTCSFEFTYTRRTDRHVTCPRCTPSTRWARKPLWTN